jgi:hypothetical protein
MKLVLGLTVILENLTDTLYNIQVSKTSTWRATKLVKLKLYKTTVVGRHIMHKLASGMLLNNLLG